jgi:hypothetical protein
MEPVALTLKVTNSYGTPHFHAAGRICALHCKIKEEHSMVGGFAAQLQHIETSHSSEGLANSIRLAHASHTCLWRPGSGSAAALPASTAAGTGVATPAAAGLGTA